MELTTVFIDLGLLLLVGLAVDLLGRRTRLPRVTLLILVGFIAGPSGFDLLEGAIDQWFQLIANMALAMVGYLLGGKLTRDMLLQSGKLVLWLSLVEALITAAVVGLGLWLVGVPLTTALLFAAIATATDPVATEDVIEEEGARGPFSNVLRGIVAIDDAWGLVVFSLVLVAVQAVDAQHAEWTPLLEGLWEIAGAVGLGVLFGVPVAFLSGRIAGANPLLLEVMGAVLLCAGVAMWLEVSYLLSCVVLGVVVANLNGHQVKPFETLEKVEAPVIVLFFLLSGASLKLDDLRGLEWLVAAYVLFRVAGRVLGGWLGALPGWVDKGLARWIGVAMQSQAGVALALAFIIYQDLPGPGQVILPVVIASTVLFELFGPIATRQALLRRGEIKAGGSA